MYCTYRLYSRQDSTNLLICGFQMDLKKNVKKKILFLLLYMMETSFLKQNLEVTQMRSVVSLPTDTLVNSQLTGTN